MKKIRGAFEDALREYGENSPGRNVKQKQHTGPLDLDVCSEDSQLVFQQ